MKKLLYRKLFLDYMSFFFIALISSSLIIWIFRAVNFLDIMIEDGREYKVYFSYSLLNFPKIISRLLPFILFFSVYYILTKYENNNELIIFWNFGEENAPRLSCNQERKHRRRSPATKQGSNTHLHGGAAGSSQQRQRPLRDLARLHRGRRKGTHLAGAHLHVGVCTSGVPQA